jgi:hypothetical protein
VVVTSATIDADRFAKHFESSKGPAPVIQVSGRTYPVEQRWRPFEESRDYGLNEAIADGVDELWQGNAGGDILVFLPGEREIREAADHLRKHLAHQPVTRNAEVLPLFARLSQAEQDRIFDGHTGRRIVLATNVAETSLTVPGIRYVIDAGTARVKRYSLRSKVEQLLVEPISQAAANQRAGRCGRVANGICIRLYDEKDFAGRPRFTDPEILRSSLAGVILRMKSLHLGVVEDFPFIDAPSGRAIADGYQLLNETGRSGRQKRAHAHGARTVQAAAGPARGPHDPRSACARGTQRGAGDCQRAEPAGCARPPHGRAAAGRPAARQVRRRQERVFRLPQALAVAAGRARRRACLAFGAPAAGPGAHARPLAGRAASGAAQGCSAGAACPHASDPHAQAQQPPVRAALAPELHQRAPCARMARRAQPTAHRGDGAPLGAQHPAGQLRGAAPVHALGLTGQHRLQARGRGPVPGRARHQVPPPPGRAPAQEAGALDRLRRTGGDHAPVRPGHRRHRAAMARRGGCAPAEETGARPALGEKGRRGGGLRARHALWPGGLQRPPRGLREGGPARRARAVHPRGPGGRRGAAGLGQAPALPGRQRQAHRPRCRSWSTSRAARTCWWTRN